ncbi:cell wall anchor protein [Streptococcus agalactiae]|uniref:LPXTG cell wall anchor domain-containing protein n=1 Tax=Streptococcus agalactiae TaxID=1311 RepID=UPI0006401F71|nr:LPXTG cell wall anchor domain-containing protein [Streptococcus agalactiae]KLJ78390.1 cell wall anchor protein [Streptococcus agalactiae]
MKKKQLLSALALSTLALAQAGFVSADEVTPVDPSAPSTEVVTPAETSTPAVTTDTTVPVDTTAEQPAPVDPTTPDTSSTTDKPQGKDNAGSLDGVPTDKPVTPSTPEPGKPQGKDNAESLDGVPAEKPKTTDEANEQGKSQIGTTSTSTGQTVQDVTEQNPVRTNTGAQIVSTRDGQVILSDGTVTSPEAIGAKTNADKTITVTKEDGSTVTLPHTGDKNTVAFGILGAMTAVAGLTLAFKHKKKA